MRMMASRFLRKLADFLDPRITPQSTAALEELQSEWLETFGFELPIIK